MSGAIALGDHLPTVQLDHSLHQSQSQPQPAATPVEAAIGLREGLEDPRERVRVDANPGVGDFHDRLSFALGQRYGDASFSRREFYGVAEKISEDLSQPRGIGNDPDCFPRQLDSDFAILAQRAMVLNR